MSRASGRSGSGGFASGAGPQRERPEDAIARDHNVVRWTEFGRGGHFPAMEAPALLVDDIRSFFRGIT